MKPRGNIRNALLLFSIFLFLAGTGGIPGAAMAQTGLVAYYPFNGNANDESGNGNNGIVGNIPYNPVLTEDRFGAANSAYVFDGVDDFIHVLDNSSLDITGGITLVAWIYPSEKKTQHIVRKGPEANTSPYDLHLSQTGDVIFSLTLNGGSPEVRKIGYDVNRWTFVAGTYDGTSMKLYVDGVLANTLPTTGSITQNNSELLIGTRLNLPADTFKGKLDEIRIYNRALTNGEIVQLYDGMIDPTKWADLEFVREIVDHKLVSEVRAPNTNDSTGSDPTGHTYRWANNSLNFPEPQGVNSIQADVSVLRIIHTNPNSGTRAMLTGRWYSWYDNDTQKGGDIWAAVFLGATPGGGLEARWEVYRFTNPEGTTWEYVADGVFETSVTSGENYTLYISYDSDLNQFTFKIGNEPITFGPIGLPVRNGNANTSFKGLRTRVWLQVPTQGPTESGYISATFANVKKNGVDYDKFDDPADMGMINKDRWNPWELVRLSNEGLFELTLTRYGSNGSNNMSFVNSQAILGFEADLKVVECQNNGARPQGRLYASLYNDGTGSSTTGGIKGDVIGSVGILEEGGDPQAFYAFYAVSRCAEPNCNLPGEYEILTSGIFKSVALNEMPRFSLSWIGSNITLGCDGSAISYNPTSNPTFPAPIAGPPKGRKGIGTRVSEINTTEWAYVAAAFDNVVITEMDTDLDSLADSWEMANFGNLSQVAPGDFDNDGLTNLQEYQLGTNPTNTDTDGDGMPDGWEVANGLNPLVNDAGLDPDGDGLTNLREYQLGFNPNIADTRIISGTVLYKEAELEGVTMDGFPVAYNTTPVVTNGTGYYSGIVPYGWSGTVTPGKTGYTFIPDSTTYTNVTENKTQNYDALSAATTTKREEETGGLKICSEFTDESGYPTKMYNCLDPSKSACNCPEDENLKKVWELKPFSDIEVELDHITWVGPGPDPYSVDIITGSSTCVRRCYPSGYCYVGPPGCAGSSSLQIAAVASDIVLPPLPPVITFRKEKIGDVEICSEPGEENTSGCPTLVYSCGDTLKTPWPTAQFSEITAGTGSITWVGIGSDPICPTVNIITTGSTCVKRCYPSGYCYVGPTGCTP
jgi:hypothetical protein